MVKSGKRKSLKKSQSTRGWNVLDWCETKQDEFSKWDRDCRLVSSYYSGKKIESEEDAKNLGLIQHANYQTGRQTLQQAKEEEFSAWEAPRYLMSFKLKQFSGTSREKTLYEGLFNKCVDRMVRERDPKFLAEVDLMVDRKTMHGDAVMMFPPEGEGWRPFFGKIITEATCPQDVHDDNFYRWGIYADLQISDVLEGIANEDLGWTDWAGDFLEAIYKSRLDEFGEEGKTKNFQESLAMLRNVSPEESENTEGFDMFPDSFCTQRIKVFYVYEKDFSAMNDDGVPINLTIVSRVESMLEDGKKEKKDLPDPMLYHQKAAFPNVSAAIADFVQDANLGVLDKTWTTIKGLGHLNYTPDMMVNRLVSSLVNSATDQNTPLWQVANGADARKMEKWIKQGYVANSLIPENLNLVDKTKQGMKVGEAINTIGFLQGLSNQNAIGQTQYSNPQRDELRVNAADRQRRDAKVANNRGRTNARKINALCVEMGRRITQELTQRNFDGEAARQVNRLRAELEALQVPYEWFVPENVEVAYTRLSGDGDPLRRMEIANEKLRNIGLIPAESRNQELMEWYAALSDGDWVRAEEMYGKEASGPAPDQVNRAFEKAAQMVTIGKVFQVTNEDVPESQLPALIGVLEEMKNEATQAGAFDPAKAKGFMAIFQHAGLLVNVLEQIGQRQIAENFKQHLMRLQTEARGPLTNMQKKQEQNPEQMMKMQELQLKANDQQLKARKQQASEQQAAERMDLQERRQQLTEYTQLSQLEIQKRKQRLEQLKAEAEVLEREIQGVE